MNTKKQRNCKSLKTSVALSSHVIVSLVFATKHNESLKMLMKTKNKIKYGNYVFNR